MYMDGKTGIGWDNEQINITKELEVVENHGCPRPERNRRIEGEE